MWMGLFGFYVKLMSNSWVIDLFILSYQVYVENDREREREQVKVGVEY